MSFCSDYIIINQQYFQYNKKYWKPLDSKGKKLSNIKDATQLIDNRGPTILFNNDKLFIVNSKIIKNIAKEDYITQNSVGCDFLSCKFFKEHLISKFDKLNIMMTNYLGFDKWNYIYDIIVNVITNTSPKRTIVFNYKYMLVFKLLFDVVSPIVNKMNINSDGHVVYKNYNKNLCIFGNIVKERDITIYKGLKAQNNKIMVLLNSSEDDIKKYMCKGSEIYSNDKKTIKIDYETKDIRSTLFNIIVNSCLANTVY